MQEFIEELKYNQNINMEKGLENRIDIDYVIERLENINISEEFIKGEIYFNIENMINDDYLEEETKEKLKELEDEDIKDIVDDILYNGYISGNMNDYIESALNRLVGE